LQFTVNGFSWFGFPADSGRHFILNEFHLLASLNLLEKMRLSHEDHSLRWRSKMKEVFGDGFVTMGVGRVIEIGE
jgi:hypothetical protein